MILYVCPAEVNGGILQLATTLTRETIKFTDCVLYVPESVPDDLYKDIVHNVKTYKRVKTMWKYDRDIKELAKEIAEYNPDIIIFVEDIIMMQQLVFWLHKFKKETAIIVHDVKHHPYRDMSFRRICVDYIRRKMMKRTVMYVNKVILLSNNSKLRFEKEYGVNNTVLFRLSAHVPKADAVKPPELKAVTSSFFLFFGRLDEYKGIDDLCKAYGMVDSKIQTHNKLIIAGNGTLSQEESSLINSNENILLIKRFIEDAEMMWLFQNCCSVVLPYKEASQSGVLPMSYYYGKPVIVSNLDGLTENVIEGQTGFVYEGLTGLAEDLAKSVKMETCDMESSIADYFNKYYMWGNNIKKLLIDLKS